MQRFFKKIKNLMTEVLDILKTMCYYPIFDTWKTKKSCGPLP